MTVIIFRSYFLLAALTTAYFINGCPVSAESPTSLCACLSRGECLPSKDALVICTENGAVRYYHRKWMLTPEIQAQQLLEQLHEGSAATRTNAVTDLGVLGAHTPEILRAITVALTRDESKWVRRAAARALGRLRIASAADALRIALRDTDKWVAYSAGEALRQLVAQDTNSL